jgi:hypothetical protein
MTDQEIIAALYSRLHALRQNVADAAVSAEAGRSQEAWRRLKTAFAIDDKAAEAMHAKQFGKGESNA